MAPKKVMITGISGIVGSSAYLQMRQSPEKYDLYGLGRRRVLSDRVKDARDIDLPAENHRVADIADFEAVLEAVTGMDVVVHMAADPSGGQWESVLRNNIVGAYNVFEACRQAGVKRIVAASTIQVSTGHRNQPPYDAVSQGRHEPLPDGVPMVGVDVPAEPRNLYASSKVFNESLCRTFAFSHGMSCLAIRIGWVVGEDRVPNARAEDIWCSQRDIAGVIQACVDAPEDLRFDIFYGMSDNRYRWVDLGNAREQLGWEPQDRAEDRLPRE
ncbi:MAG TPA: NAD(P)-dependent oxidoreductase [Candidatus Latescibacteria bacterium]|jgi:nucleoside-diphosphate-sugar epimerase|nr:NAD(P)-dependent oxidoreductase [Candidatus Latescibacterota bacterium]HJP32917.1 NAD(P)-dependent oxidoreductase [Candidatus Latescibacterota bacterium]